MNINDKIFGLTDLITILRTLDFHVIKKGDYYILYHIPTGTLWKADNEDFEQTCISSTISDLLKRISKRSNISERIYRNILKYKPSSKIVLIVTTLCNMGCDYCYASQGSYGLPEENMSKDIAKQAIDKLERTFGKTNWIQFFGGEPLLNFDIIKFVVKYLKRRKPTVKFSINTNGSFMTDEMARFLGENITDIYISVDGPPEIHNLHRKFRNDIGSWDVIIRNVRKLRKYLGKNSKLLAETTYTKEHLEKNYSMVELWKYLTKDIGFDDAYIAWASYSSTEDFENSQWLNIGRLFSEFIESCFNKAIETSILSEWKTMLSKKYFFHPQPCTAGLSTLTITPRGDIFPCFQLIKEDLRMGNILDVSFPDDHFKSIWKTLFLNSRLTCKECLSCWLRNVCRNCLGKRYTFSGDIYEPVPKECELRKKIVEQTIKFIVE